MLRNLAVLLFGCCLISIASAQDAGAKKDEGAKADKAKSGDLTDPTEILKKADEACKAVKFVKYTVSAKATGTGDARAPAVDGTVIQQGFKMNLPEKWHCDLKAKQADSEETKHVILGFDGKEFYVIDPEKKIAYVDIDPAVLGSARIYLPSSVMAELGHERPFADEIAGDKKELRGTTKVGDEECYEVYVKYAGQPQEVTWFISKKDFLPRRADRDLPPGQNNEPRKLQTIVTALTVDPKFDKDPFKFELPEGYTKSGDFAP